MATESNSIVSLFLVTKRQTCSSLLSISSSSFSSLSPSPSLDSPYFLLSYMRACARVRGRRRKILSFPLRIISLFSLVRCRILFRCILAWLFSLPCSRVRMHTLSGDNKSFFYWISPLPSACISVVSPRPLLFLLLLLPFLSSLSLLFLPPSGAIEEFHHVAALIASHHHERKERKKR